jgi:hypothetical protein
MTGLRRGDEALLVQLADGALTGPERARAEERVRNVPDGDRLLARQRRVARALRGGTAPARARAAEPERVRAWPRLAIAGALVTMLVLAWMIAPGGDRTTTQQAADIAKLSATEPAPATTGSTLRAGIGGLRFPDWAPQFGWHATGMRRDVIDGRRTATVYYEHMGHKLAYTIVSGPVLPPPANAHVVVRDGLEISLYRDSAHGGHDVAVFERGGRTCVVAGHVLHIDTLLKLAAWKGDGQIRS